MLALCIIEENCKSENSYNWRIHMQNLKKRMINDNNWTLWQVNVIEAKSSDKTWNKGRQRSRLWYKQENTPSAKKSGEEESALNEWREKIKKSWKKKKFCWHYWLQMTYHTEKRQVKWERYDLFPIRPADFLGTIHTLGHNYFPIHVWTKHKPYDTTSTDVLCFAVFLQQRRGCLLFNSS